MKLNRHKLAHILQPNGQKSPFFHLSAFSPPSFFLSSSGLSFEESKELTKADLNRESVRAPSPSHQTVPAAHAPEDPKGTEDSSQPAVAAAAPAAKNIKPTQEHLKPLPAQKEPVFTPEPMKTRRSQYAEERRLSAAAQPAAAAAAADTPALEKRTEQAAVGSLPEKEPQKEAKEEKTEPPQSPVKKSHPPKATVESKEELASAMKSAEERKEVVSGPSVTSEPQKRKSVTESEGEVTPEKRPRMSSVSSESSVSSVSPAASSTSSPPTPTLATNQRVPPLKVWKSFSEHSLSRCDAS